uniref:DNA topoisomerase 2 n=1 Tax=Leptocylindrus danicus TaxID=163516 RepID=A0A7S2P370_9STRA|mmetsp:Transcript_21503/g.32102  ORF Transcript_21503/g.32102 Transcript_21503/m.32102 type:complete len:519 (+) Transcript_21503:9-1565(+)
MQEGRMNEIAYLNAGLALTLTDSRRKNSKKKGNNVDANGNDGTLGTKIFYHAGGLAEYIELLTSTKTPLVGAGSRTKSGGKKEVRKRKRSANDPLAELLTDDGCSILITGSVVPSSEGQNASPISISVALRYSSDMFDENILSFCNNIRTKDGGSHVEGLKAALTRTVNQMAKKTGKLKDGSSNLPGEFVREGLTAIVAVNIAEPEFEGQTKGRLGNPEVRPSVDTLVSKELTRLFEWSPDILNAIVDKASDAQSAAVAARAARDMVRRKSLLTSTVLPGKLADCASRTPEESEIFIVEGDSAAGSAKQGRDRNTQAILPLRGKILNIERAAAEKIYQNNELQSLISALGLGIKGTELDLSSLRYHRIVIMTDADVDGAHIRVLLLTFFYRYQRELIENGYVYIACPPLYKLTTSRTVNGSKEHYVYNDEEKDSLLNDVTASECKVTIQRFKGLGEMMPEQLWSTTMDPARRKMLKVTVDDCAAADSMLSILMGDAVAPRKDFISTHAENLKLDDLDV